MKYLTLDTILKGEIDHLPLEVADLLVQEQVLAGNSPDIHIFERDVWAGRQQGAFNWQESKIIANWREVLIECAEPVFHKRLKVIDENETFYYHGEEIKVIEVIQRTFAKIEIDGKTILTHNIQVK